MRISPEAYPLGFAAYLQPLLDARRRLLSSLTLVEKLVCARTIEAFPLLGRGPTLAELTISTHLPRAQVQAGLEQLNDRDLLKYERGTKRVLALYPFSDIPCPHQVQLQGKPRLYAM